MPERCRPNLRYAASLLPGIILALVAILINVQQDKAGRAQRVADHARLVASSVDLRLGELLQLTAFCTSAPALTDTLDLVSVAENCGRYAERIGAWVVLVTTGETHRQILNTRPDAPAVLPSYPRANEQATLRALETRTRESGAPGIADVFTGIIYPGGIVSTGQHLTLADGRSAMLYVSISARTLSDQLAGLATEGGPIMGLIDPSRRVVARSVGIERAMFADAPDWIEPFMQADAAGAALGVPGPEVIGGTWDAGYHPLTAAPGWMAATFKPTPAGTWFLAPGSVPSAITFLGVVLSALLFWVMTDRDRVARRIAESERRNQEKSRLLASFAHDIRSPLISLIGSLELNREGRGPETGQVRSARSSAEALLQLVDDILELSFLGSGELTLHPSPVDLRQVAEALSDQIRPLVARKGLELCLDIDPSLPVSVEVDRLRLQQVLSNLLTNAVKYTDRGTVTLRIHKAGTREGHVMLDLAVIDTGVGIEPEDIPRILQEFGRLEREAERREHGAGLGLAIVQRILTKMGAKLAVKTTPGQGSAFSFRLRIPIATGREVAGAVRPLSDIVILYAEDEPVIREVTARRLEEAGAWVICAEDGEDALRQLGTMAPDLLLIDLQMPGLDGVGLIQRLKDDSPGRTFPLFVLTSHISGPQAAEARAAGADAVFTKPVQVAALAAAFRARRGDAGRSTPIAGETANAEGESYIDAAKLNELVAILDPVRAVALIEEFEVTMRRDLSGLEAAIATTDLIQAMKLAHRGKGLCLVMGTSALASRLSAVELAAEARDAEAARALMRDAPKCLELTLQAMNAAVQASASSPSTMHEAAAAFRTVTDEETTRQQDRLAAEAAIGAAARSARDEGERLLTDIAEYLQTGARFAAALDVARATTALRQSLAGADAAAVVRAHEGLSQLVTADASFAAFITARHQAETEAQARAVAAARAGLDRDLAFIEAHVAANMLDTRAAELLALADEARSVLDGGSDEAILAGRDAVAERLGALELAAQAQAFARPDPEADARRANAMVQDAEAERTAGTLVSEARQWLADVEAFVALGRRLEQPVPVAALVARLRAELDNGGDLSALVAAALDLTADEPDLAGFRTRREEQRQEARTLALREASQSAEQGLGFVIDLVSIDPLRADAGTLLEIADALRAALDLGDGPRIAAAEAEALAGLSALGLAEDLAAYRARIAADAEAPDVERRRGENAVAQTRAERDRDRAEILLSDIDAYVAAGGRFEDTLTFARALSALRRAMDTGSPPGERLETLERVLGASPTFVSFAATRDSARAGAAVDALALAQAEASQTGTFIEALIEADPLRDDLDALLTLVGALDAALRSADAATIAAATAEAAAQLAALGHGAALAAHAAGADAAARTAQVQVAANGLSVSALNEALLLGDPGDLMILANRRDAPHLHRSLIGTDTFTDGRVSACWVHEPPQGWSLGLARVLLALADAGLVPGTTVPRCSDAPADLLLLQRGVFLALSADAAAQLVHRFEDRALDLWMMASAAETDALSAEMLAEGERLAAGIVAGAREGWGLVVFDAPGSALCLGPRDAFDPRASALALDQRRPDLLLHRPVLRGEIAEPTLERMLPRVLRGDCGAIWAASRDLARLLSALVRDGVGHRMTPLWADASELRDLEASIVATDADRNRTLATLRQDLLRDRAVSVEMERQRRIALAVEQADLRARFAQEARAAQDRITALVPYQANRCLEVISKMFSLSEMWGLRPDGTNPRKHIRKYPEEKRERFLSAAELRRIGEVLREMEAEGVELPSAILAARLLILTGCRLNEIMSLKWSYADLDVPALRLPDSKTGAKVVHVGQPVADLLRGAQRIDGNPWVITGTLPGKPLSDLQPFWQRVRARAGVKDVRIHDLRHTFASTAVASGQGLPMIGKLLGHTQVQTTARYAHLAAEPVRMAADAVAQNLRQSLG